MTEYFIKLCLFVLLFAGCTQSTEPEISNLTGEWIWTQSIGGFAGQKLTPESENKTQVFIFEGRREFKLYQNGEILRSGTYSLIEIHRGNRTLPGIEFSDSDIESIIEEAGDTLKLRETCADCFMHWYEKGTK